MTLFPILTQQKKVPFLWIVLMNFSWFVGLYTMFVVGTALPFTMRRFTDDTRLMSLVTSVGLWFGIILGPLVNYISDRIWTRFGRRRPFMLVAICGTLLSMFSIPFMPALSPLIMVVVVSSILGDVGSTQEPLWLEVIPSSQRGTAVAVRTLMISMASLLFFQIMFAQFDFVYHLPGGMTLTGEQMCYLSAGILQLLYLLLLAFGIREVKPDGVTLQHPAEIRSEQLLNAIEGIFAERRWWHYLFLCPLPAPWMLALAERSRQRWVMLLLFPSAFLARFIRDVFCETRWWWIYMFYIAGTFMTAGGGFANLMLVEQFHYSKPRIALTGLPGMIIGNAVIIPFMGWYADRLPRIPVWLLGGLAAGGGTGLWYFMTLWGDVPKLDLPPFWAMMVMLVLATVAVGAFEILLFQGLRSLNPAANPRIWAWLLNMVKTLLGIALTYAIIKLSSGSVPSMTNWYLMMCICGAMGILTIVSGPLYYDFLPKDKIGTISSGCGLLSTTVSAVISTFVGVWIFYFTKWSSGHEATSATQDYSSYLVMQLMFGMITIVFTAVFFYRFMKGRIVEYGRLGLNSTDPAPENHSSMV
jgi:MFS family permease